jgi:hypothetical protein
VSVRSRTRRLRFIRCVIVAGVAALSVVTHDARAASGGSYVKAAAAQAGTPHPALGPAAGRVLGGLTAQGLPVVMAIAGNSKRIDGTKSVFQMHCTSGLDFMTPDSWARLPIRADGSVSITVAVPPIPASGAGDAITGGSDSFVGKLDRKRATFSGVWQLHLNFATSNGQTDSCDSGHVTFKVRL